MSRLVVCARMAIATTVVVALAFPTGASGREGYLRAEPSADGMVFPVARSTWYSVINFTNDWHDPRMRLIGGRWVLVGRHEGNDIFAEPGTPIRSVTGGVIENVGWTFYSGWRVGVRDAEGNYWFYAHMRRFANGVVEGASVAPGSILGEVGNTGYGEEPGHFNEFTYHVHVGIQRPTGVWVNPYPLMTRLYRRSVEATR